MSCEHLVCAHCAGPVSEGRCPVCRAGRAQFHRHPVVTVERLAYALLAAIVAVLVAMTLTHATA
ncbi:MAG: hypothetical protein ACYCYA_12415 [Actinomycetes bacterium]